jgi:hypothetical protein
MLKLCGNQLFQQLLLRDLVRHDSCCTQHSIFKDTVPGRYTILELKCVFINVWPVALNGSHWPQPGIPTKQHQVVAVSRIKWKFYFSATLLYNLNPASPIFNLLFLLWHFRSIRLRKCFWSSLAIGVELPSALSICYNGYVPIFLLNQHLFS